LIFICSGVMNIVQGQKIMLFWVNIGSRSIRFVGMVETFLIQTAAIIQSSMRDICDEAIF
jgi:hypothetical protein